MINREDLVRIGQFRKPHGTKGELAFIMTDSIRHSSTDVIAGSTRNPLNNCECPFLICEIDGIFVPFRIENYRIISDSTIYVQLKNINSDRQARILTQKEVYFPKKHLGKDDENDSSTWNYFIDFTLTDEWLGKIGRIVDVDTTTINTLFIVEKGSEEILIPAVEEFIIRIDENQRELLVALPEGLVE